MDNKSISSDLIRGHIDTIILYSLFNEDKFAQQISDSIEQNSNNEYKINQATLYSSLKRLETLKHVSSYWKDADDNGRRKFFHLTEQGKEIVESNLSNWSYSKQIIDKLMGCEQPAEIKTVYVIKNDQNSSTEQVDQIEDKDDLTANFDTQTPKNAQNLDIFNVFETKQEETKDIQENTATKSVENDKIDNDITPTNNQAVNNDTETVQEETEINFRAILGGIIPNKPKKQEEIAEKKQPQKPEIIEVSKPKEEIIEEKPTFNETIQSGVSEDYVTIGKIDFSDLKIKAAQEGYKIRISSKDSATPDGTLKINKLNFFTALLTFLLAASVYVVGYFHTNSIINVENWQLIAFASLVAIYPFISTIIYIISPKTTTTKRVHADSILTCAIIIFNLLLILFAATFLTEMDFSNKINLIKYVFAPVSLMVFALLYFVIKVLLSKCKIFYRKKS